MSLEKVPQNIKDLAVSIRSGLNFDAEGVGSTAEDTFERSLPEDLPLDVVKKVQNHILDFADATGLALGEAGLDHLKDNADLKSVSVKIKAGTDAISSEFFRGVERRNPTNGETFIKRGVLTTKLSTGVGAGRGNYKRIQDDLSERATSVFAQ